MRHLTDFHSHILPGIDDGSQSVEESLAMLRMEAEQGVRRVVATPHFYARHDSPERFLHRRDQAWEQLRQAMKDTPGLPAVELGAEVYFFPGMSESDALSELTIGENRVILLEMPQSAWTDSMYREMAAIYDKQGITPIIAHIDRYISPFRAKGILRRLEELPVLVQANAEFFLDRRTSRMALRMLQAEQIHLLGSDCHDLSARKPNMGDALALIKKRLGDAAVDRVCSYESIVFTARNA